MSKIYKPRLIAPDINNKAYINTEYGGYNSSIVIDATNGFVMPNCVGYSQGRMIENLGLTAPDYSTVSLFNANPIVWVERAKKAGFKTGKEPKLGGSIIWKSGHVNTIEEIHDDGTIITSNSGFNSYLFRTETVGKDMKRYGGDIETIIYLPEEFVAEKPEDTIWRVQLGAYVNTKYCMSFAYGVKNDLPKITGNAGNVIIKYKAPWYTVQVGAYTIKQNAINMRDKFRRFSSKYSDAYITDEDSMDYAII